MYVILYRADQKGLEVFQGNEQAYSTSTIVTIGGAESAPPPFPCEKEDILKAVGIRVKIEWSEE